MRRQKFAELSAHITGGNDGQGGGDGPVLVLLHGFGAPGTDLLPMAEELELPDSVRCVFPMAPLVLEPGAPDGLAARAWWMIDMVELQVAMYTKQYEVLTEREPSGLAAARAQLEAFLLALQRELSVEPNELILGGFSQGAMLALDTALDSRLALGGLALLSGSVLRRSRWLELAPRRAGLPVFISHGMADAVLPFALAEESERLLKSAGLDVEFTPFSGGHGIPGLVLSRLGAFARKLWA